MVNIFDFKTYKAYLSKLCEEERGLLTRLSEAAGCQKSYLSACLTGKNQITLDHALGMSEYLQLVDGEEEYLFTLIEKERASTPKLQRKLDAKLKVLSREAYRLKNQQNATVVVDSKDNSLSNYYATWLPTAIHTMTSIDSLQTVAEISKRLQLAPEGAQFFLNFLISQDLIKKVGNHYVWNSGNIHLADDSNWLSTHHLNWRFRAIDNFQKRDQSATHYTAIQSMSVADFELLKKKIAKFIKEFNSVSDPSTPEEVFCFNIDFFKI
jgi:uncharacterized protein (TIGR02147 family)